jgi:hypothetical protein
MMHMSSVQEEIKIRQFIGHDEKHEDARDHKRDEKTEQGASRQFMRRLARDGMFRVQKSPVGLSLFQNCVEKFFGCSIHPSSSDFGATSPPCAFGLRCRATAVHSAIGVASFAERGSCEPQRQPKRVADSEAVE